MSAKAIYGTYVGLVYLTPIAGGWIADRILGLRRTVLYGGIVIAIGHYLDGHRHRGHVLGRACWPIALGTGLLKPNISGMVGQLYAEGDTKRDAGFSHLLHGHQHRRPASRRWSAARSARSTTGTGASARPASA